MDLLINNLSWLYESLVFMSGNEKCQGLGGRLPTVTSMGKATFLQNTFKENIWIGLRTDSS